MKETALRFFISFSLLTLLCINVSSQKEFNARAFFVEAESYFLFEEYSDALPLYQRILSQEPENYNVMYKIGVCYLNDLYQKERSIKYLAEASKHLNPKYRLNTYKENLAPLDALYYLGQAHRVTGSLDEAIKYYNEFKSTVDPAIYNFDVVNAELASCEIAKELLKTPVYNKAINLGDEINTRFAEITPILSGDGKTLVFTRELQFYDAVFISKRNSDGTWSPPYNLTPEFGLDGNSYATGISYNGDEVFVYRSDDFDGNIYSSKKVDKQWQTLVKLNLNINTKYWESHASVSADGKYLYFTSNRKGGFGGLDIYRSAKGKNGEWGVAVNLGPIVNSEYNDDKPFVSPAGDKLYFSSLGHNSMGGFDIFVSKKTESGKWSKPVNMGAPLNTTDDDLFFCPVSVNQYSGIYSYYDQNSSYGLKDLYWIEVYNEILPRPFALAGQVNVPSQDLLEDGNITASLVDSKTGKIISQAQADSLGEFKLDATQGEYQLLVDGKGIKPVSVPVLLDLNQEEQNVNLALITATASAIGEDEILSPAVSLPKLQVKGEQYIITDTTPITINLDVEEGSELKVETFVENKLTKTEEFYVSKSKFSYVLVPESGENRILFTITDNNGNINQEEIIVYYTPKADTEPIAEEIEEADQTGLPELALIAGTGLQPYLQTLGDVNFDSKTDLYNMLVANAEGNDYTVEDVNELFALMLTQRDKDEFLTELNNTREFDQRRLNDSVLANTDMPISIVNKTKNQYSNSEIEINTGLVSMVPYTGSSDSEIDYILSFIGREFPEGAESNRKTNTESWNELQALVGEEEASSAVELASTTEALEQYYQNLLISSDGAIKDLLLGINFEEQGINNSIDLVNFMIEKAPENNISLTELISVLETSQNNQNTNLHKFKEALAYSATGELKMAIDDLNIEEGNYSGFEQILDELLKQSKTSGYSPQEVYELLLGLIGIEKTEELLQALRTSSTGQLDSLLGTIDTNEFSKPVELIQYLLSQSAYFDYTDSDINNLLLRMLLEKGVDNYSETEEVLYSEKLIKRRKVVATIVLANALLIILLLIFWRRKKKK